MEKNKIAWTRYNTSRNYSHSMQVDAVYNFNKNALPVLKALGIFDPSIRFEEYLTLSPAMIRVAAVEALTKKGKGHPTLRRANAEAYVEEYCIKHAIPDLRKNCYDVAAGKAEYDAKKSCFVLMDDDFDPYDHFIPEDKDEEYIAEQFRIIEEAVRNLQIPHDTGNNRIDGWTARLTFYDTITDRVPIDTIKYLARLRKSRRKI